MHTSGRGAQETPVTDIAKILTSVLSGGTQQGGGGGLLGQIAGMAQGQRGGAAAA